LVLLKHSTTNVDELTLTGYKKNLTRKGARKGCNSVINPERNILRETNNKKPALRPALFLGVALFVLRRTSKKR